MHLIVEQLSSMMTSVARFLLSEAREKKTAVINDYCLKANATV